VVFLVDFFLELEESLVLSVAESLFGGFSVLVSVVASVLASVFFVLLFVESALLFLSVLVVVLVDASVAVLVEAGLLVVAGLVVVEVAGALDEGFVVEVGG
jgi:hypothetical protein